MPRVVVDLAARYLLHERPKYTTQHIHDRVACDWPRRATLIHFASHLRSAPETLLKKKNRG
jgi:hypothetical protein